RSSARRGMNARPRGVSRTVALPVARASAAPVATERSALSFATASVRSPAAIVVSAQSADGSEKTTSGISFIGVANGAGGAGPEGRPLLVRRGTHEVRAGVAHGLDAPCGALPAPRVGHKLGEVLSLTLLVAMPVRPFAPLELIAEPGNRP